MSTNQNENRLKIFGFSECDFHRMFCPNLGSQPGDTVITPKFNRLPEDYDHSWRSFAVVFRSAEFDEVPAGMEIPKDYDPVVFIERRLPRKSEDDNDLLIALDVIEDHGYFSEAERIRTRMPERPTTHDLSTAKVESN